MYTETSSDSNDDFTKPQFIGCCLLIVLAGIYIFICANHQTKLMEEKYGQKKDNPVIHVYH